MTNIEQLMQDSEVMRMLKIGNPERSKDFHGDELEIGLFDIERQLRQPFEQAIYSSEDPNGAIERFDTSLMLNNLGIDMESAQRMSESGFASSATGIDTRDKNYWEALKTTAQHSHWQDMKGITTSLYRITGNTDFLDVAREYDGKIHTNPVFNTYGKFGDLVLDSVQPTMSSLKFITTTALLSWIPGGIANKVWGPAVARTVAKGGGMAAAGVNWFSTGYSQAGDVLYNVMQTEDAEGNTLPWDSPVGGVLFHSLAGLMGLVELGSMEMFPWYKQLKTRFTNRELAKHIERGLSSAIKSTVVKGTVGTGTEGGEEGIQTGLGIGFENALKAMANKDGAEFDITSLGDTVSEAAKATYEAGKSMFLTSFLTAGIGQGAYSARLRASSRKNFTPSKNSIPIDSSFVGVPKGKLEERDENAVSGPIEPIRVVNVGTHLAPVNEVELEKATRAANNGAEAMEVIVEDLSPMESGDQLSILNRAAVATEAKIIENEKLGFNSEEEMDRAVYLLASNTEAIQRTDSGVEITIRSEDGKLSKLALTLIEEGQETADPDISYVDDPEAPYSLSRMTGDRALEWQERQIIKQAIGDIVSHTGGRISTADLEANVDAVKLAAETLGIPTDRMLEDNLVFKLEKASPKGERGAIENITIDGRKQYTIHLSEKADATTLLHEIGHFIRGTASKEQLADFTEIYGRGQQAVWLEDINKIGDKYEVNGKQFETFDEAKQLVESNEEAFADDFVAYLRTGEAPSEGLQNIFHRMKAVLQRFMKEFGYQLNPEVKQAFDRLLTRDGQGVQGSYGTIPADAQGNVLFQTPEYEAVVQRYKNTRQWMRAPNGNPTNLTEQKWVQVRTPSFKKWFGDWESASHKKYLEGLPIGIAPGNQFEADGVSLSKKVSSWYEGEGYSVVDVAQIGKVSLDKRAVKNSISHGLTRAKAEAFAIVPEILRFGRLIDQHTSDRDENLSIYVLAAPVRIAKQDYVGVVLVKADKGTKRMYVHEVVLKEKLQQSAFKTEASTTDTSALNGAGTGAIKRVIQNIYAVNEAPKVVDENGEPKVLYHGSPAEGITQFDRQGANGGEHGLIYATDSERGADDFSYEQLPGNSNLSFRPGRRGHVYPLYMKIQNPLDFRSLTTTDYDNIRSAIETYGIDRESKLQALDEMMLKERVGHQYAKFVASDLLSHLSDYDYDGLIAEMRNGGPLEYAVVSPMHVKSIDNQGTWDFNNPNILFQPSPPPESTEFKVWFGDWELNPENASKVVKDAKPLIVYNGVRTDPGDVYTSYSNVRPEGGKFGFFFTPYYDVAKTYAFNKWEDNERVYGPVKEVYLNIRNPLMLDRWMYTWDAFKKELAEKHVEVDQEVGWKRSFSTWNYFVSAPASKEAWVNSEDLKSSIQKAGYDGVIFKDDSAVGEQFGGNKRMYHEDLKKLPDDAGIVYVAFSPSQIKSVNNQGTWNPDNPNILFQESPPKSSEEYQALLEKTHAILKENGVLKTFYHGGESIIEDFIPERRGSNSGAQDAEAGFFFTSEREVAEGYANRAYPVAQVERHNREIERLRDLELQALDLGDDSLSEQYGMQAEALENRINEIDTQMATGEFFGDGKVTQVHITLENPLIVDMGGEEKESFTDLIDQAQSNGNDGLFVQNVIDSVDSDIPSNIVIVFDADNIFQAQDALNNQGAWDPDNPNVLYQRAHNPYRNWEPEITETGKIKGAPEWVKSRRDLNHLRHLLRKLVKEGESGRFWYEESATEVWRITQGDHGKAKKFIQLLSIYSPNNNVPNNTLMAIRAYNHWAAGLPEQELHSGMGELDNKAKRALYHDEDWIGRKTGSFYENLMYELVRKYPESFPDIDISDVATMDLWMARAFGYLVEAYSDDKGSGKYSFSENSTRRLAAELNEKLNAGDVAWTPHQIQAAIWSSMKTRYELPEIKARTNKESVKKGFSWLENGKIKNPTSGEAEKLHKQLWRKYALAEAGTSAEVKKLVEQSGFSFKEAIYDSSQIVTWEAIPSSTLGHGITSASTETKKRFTEEAKALISDVEGNDLLAEKLGVPLAFAAKGDGAYDGTVTPNVLSNLFPTRVQGQRISFDTVRMYARAIQYIYKQDAVPFFKPDSTPISSKADQEELYFKVVKYSRDEKGEITKVSTIPRSKVETQAEAEVFREEYLKNKKNLTSEDVQVHGGKFARAMVYTFKNALDDGILKEVLSELQQYLGDEVGYTRTGSEEITLINFRDDFTHAPWVHDEDFVRTLDLFFEDNADRFGIIKDTRIFTEGEYGPVYDWSESERENTETSLERSFSGRSDLHSWIRSRRALFEEILQRYSGEELRRLEEGLTSRQRTTEDSLQTEKNTLYQLSDEAKQGLLETRKSEVRQAIENFYWIPENVLQEYSGDEWADKELSFRRHLREYPWILEEARKFSDTDDFLVHLQTNTEMGEYHWVLEDELWFKRVHAYSRMMSPKDKDAQFVRMYTGTDKALVGLGRRLRGYEDVESVGNAGTRRRGSSQRIVYRWGAFKGVSPVVKRLDANSTEEELQRARKAIQDNPRPYRKALQVIDQAQDRVLEMRGLAPDSEATRDAYYDMLGEQMEEALNEPLLLNQMTDRQAAEYLRNTKDKRERYNAREKLATHDGVIAMEQQANAELKKLGAEKDQDISKAKKQLSKVQSELKEVSDSLRDEKKALKSTQSALDKERARAWKLVEKLDEKSKQASKVGQLERELADRRNRVGELRRALSARNLEMRKIARKVELLQAKLENQKLLEALEGVHKKILATVKFNPDTIDASFEESFNAIYRLLDQNQKPGRWELLPQQMSQYISEANLHWIQQGRKINQWNLGELEKLLEAASLMRMDAKVMLERKNLQRMDRLQNIASQMYRQTYGELPEVGPGYGSLMNDIIDDLTQKRDTYDENIFDAMFNTIRASIGKMQRIARMLDGNKEGVAYQLLVREAYERMTEELRESYRRLQDADAKMKELKITSDYLAKKSYTYTTPSGQEKTLHKGEVIGLYVYSQNPMGAQKLIHNRGNNIPPDQLAEAIGTLTDKDKQWGDYMIDSLGGDEVWERMRDTYYEVYNRNLGRRQRYFTFVADGKVDEGKTDLLVGPQGSKIRYVDKDFTKIVNPHAIYPLKLNVTHTFTSQVKKQEHFIKWADWTRDMNYLLTRGAVGRIIDMNFGPKFLNVVQEYVNDVGSPQVILDDIERIGSKIISNAAVAALSLNFLTMLKQLPSFSAALRGDIGAMELFNVALRLSNPKTHEEAVKFIHEMSPYMLKRSISVEVEKYNASDFDSFLGRKIQAFNENIGMKGIQIMDQVAVNTLWLAAYDTYVRRNPNGLDEEALKQEATYRATQLISETQPTSIVNDLSSIQRKKSPFTRAFLLFSNQIFQYINMIWYDLPTSAKAYIATKNPKELRKMFGIVMNMAISGGMIMLVSGVAFRGDDDDEKYWDRIKREILKMIASYTLPIVGNTVSQGVSGFYGGDLVDLPTAFGRMMGTAVTDWDKMNKRVWDLLDGIGSVGGLPTAFINRAIKSLQNENPFELLGSTYGDLWEAR
ncbi:hypothetical protein [Pleomorphochaeta sp. DL1XJH-081]|uniref:ADP-ribosyltransferase-containing protein n=1 Tax=Pleomorphochaeta sp. DL1XJH-081 TaxID=3409690 RepID=UPI003BB55A75